ncbi:tetratricopeptide repeat protein [Nisaea sp.]|uniref:tetratricopeptide repeat protein n=1 Tax=Nisaea sp. TaxID=2024842 RepID=UPI003B522FF0
MTEDPQDRDAESRDADFFRQLFESSLAAHRTNRFDLAQAGYREILARYPDHAATLSLYGALLYQTNRLDAAASILERAVDLDPAQVSAWNHLGAVRLAQDRAEDALAAFQKATEADPLNVESWLNRSRLAETLGDHADAVEAARSATLHRPDHAAASARLGAALFAAGQFQEAVDPLERSIERAPYGVEPYLHLALCFKHLARAERAQTALRKAILLAPERVALYPHLTEGGAGPLRSVDKVSWARKALFLNPQDSGLWAALAAACESVRRDESAVEAAKRALLLSPHEQAAHHCLALPLFRLECFAEAAAASRQALFLYPDIAELKFVAAACAFIFDDLDTGWRFYEARAGSRIDSLRVGLPDRWDGTSEPGNLLVAAEQGVGDEYIFLSRLDGLRGCAQETTVECDPRNRPLFERSFPGFRFIDRQLAARDGGAAYFDYRAVSEELGFDSAMLAGSLLAMFIKDGHASGPRSFLVPDENEAGAWRRYFRERTSLPLVGVCWRGGTVSDARERLYCDADTMIEALGPQRACFVNLVHNLRDDELERTRTRLQCDIHDPEGIDQRNELDRLAAMLSVMDAVVAVDTAVCTLAAAVGTPTLRLGRSLLFLSDGHDAVLGSCHPMNARAEPFDMSACLARAAACLPEILLSGR